MPSDRDEAGDTYREALRKWQLAWEQRFDWHRDHIPADEGQSAPLSDVVLEQIDTLRTGEEQAYEHYLAARSALLESLMGEGIDTR